MDENGENVVKKDIGDAETVTMADFCRTLLSECFDNDNDVCHLVTKLVGPDGSESKLVFMIHIESINDVPTRDAGKEETI